MAYVIINTNEHVRTRPHKLSITEVIIEEQKDCTQVIHRQWYDYPFTFSLLMCSLTVSFVCFYHK